MSLAEAKAEGWLGRSTVESSAPALAVRSVSVRFGGVAALNGVNLSAAAGSVTGLIGPNGAGKTTLFNVISGLQRPDHGDVVLGTTTVTELGPHRRARLGLARTFQRLELFTSLTAAENVQVGLEAVGSRRGRWRRGDVEAAGDGGGRPDPRDLLERVGAGDTADQLVGALPTGSARLVELARALALDPKVILLDEPCSGLDEAESSALGELLGQLAGEGRAVLLVEHDMDLVLRICDQVHVLDFGEIIASGTPDVVRADPTVQAAYLGTTEAPATVADVGPVSSDGDRVEDGPDAGMGV